LISLFDRYLQFLMERCFNVFVSNGENTLLPFEAKSSLENSSNLSNDQCLCIICQTATSKYRCPGCERRTCSLDCSRTHKELFRCDGQRKVTRYIALQDFTDGDLFHDIHFLSDIEKLCSNLKRNSRVHRKRGKRRAKSWNRPQSSRLLDRRRPIIPQENSISNPKETIRETLVDISEQNE